MPAALGALLVVAAPRSNAAVVDQHYRAGLGFLERGQHALALDELNAAIESGITDAATRATALYAKAICLAELKRSSDARSTLEDLFRTLTAMPKDAPAFEFRADASALAARLAFDSSDFASAASYAEALLSAPITEVHERFALLVAGESRLRTGEPTVALSWLDRLLAKPIDEPTRLRAARMAAHAATTLGDDSGVVRRVRAALASPSQPTSSADRAALNLLLAQAEHRLGSLDAARSAYRATLDHDADQPDALLGVAQVSRALRMNDREASTGLDRLIAQATSDRASPAAALLPAAMIERAAFALDAGELDRALALLGGAAPAPPLRTPFLQLRARAEALSGRRADAIATIDTLLEDRSDAALVRSLLVDRSAHAIALERWAEAAQSADEARTIALAASASDPPSDNGTLLLRAGIARARLGDTVNAQRDLADALKALPADAATEREIALSESLLLAFAREDWSSSLTLATELADRTEHPSRRSGALLRAALAAIRLDRADEARAALDRLLALDLPQDDPTALRARLERSRLFHAAEDGDAALADLRIVAMAGDATLAELARARIVAALVRRNDPAAIAEVRSLLADATDDALIERSIAESAAGDHTSALASLSRFIDAHPTDARRCEALARRAILRARDGDHRGAVTDANACGDAIETLDPMLGAALALDLGLSLAALGEGDEARAALALAMTIASPYRPLAAAELTRIALEQGELEEASSVLERFAAVRIEAAPSDRASVEERFLYLQALLASRTGDHAGAARALESLLTDHRASALLRQSRLLLAESLMRSNEPARAAEALATLLTEDSALPAPTRGAAQLRLGEAWAAASRWAESEAAYAAFIADHEDSDDKGERAYAAQARFGIGWAREQRGALDAAIKAYIEVTSLSEGATAARAQFQIGECLFAQGKIDEAIREFLKVEMLYASDEWSAAALFEAGRCYASVGRTTDAHAQWTIVRDRFATTRWAALAKAELERTPTETLPGR
jgi:TolA-binding protein